MWAQRHQHKCRLQYIYVPHHVKHVSKAQQVKVQWVVLLVQFAEHARDWCPLGNAFSTVSCIEHVNAWAKRCTSPNLNPCTQLWTKTATGKILISNQRRQLVSSAAAGKKEVRSTALPLTHMGIHICTARSCTVHAPLPLSEILNGIRLTSLRIFHHHHL